MENNYTSDITLFTFIPDFCIIDINVVPILYEYLFLFQYHRNTTKIKT